MHLAECMLGIQNSEHLALFPPLITLLVINAMMNLRTGRIGRGHAAIRIIPVVAPMHLGARRVDARGGRPAASIARVICRLGVFLALGLNLSGRSGNSLVQVVVAALPVDVVDAAVIEGGEWEGTARAVGAGGSSSSGLLALVGSFLSARGVRVLVGEATELLLGSSDSGSVQALRLGPVTREGDAGFQKHIVLHGAAGDWAVGGEMIRQHVLLVLLGVLLTVEVDKLLLDILLLDTSNGDTHTSLTFRRLNNNLSHHLRIRIPRNSLSHLRIAAVAIPLALMRTSLVTKRRLSLLAAE